jgi:hypothetical protein
LQVARRLYELGHAQANGTLRAVRVDGSTAPLRLAMVGGWIHAVELSPAYSLIGDAPERGEDRLRLFLKLTDEQYRFDAWTESARPEKHGPVAPFHPAVVLRNYVDGRNLDLVLWRARVGAGRVQILRAPHPSCLGQDERPLVAYLTRPHTLAEIDSAGLLPAPRTARLLGFLDAIGALEQVSDIDATTYAVLELHEGASLEEVKRAYRRLARELHPDLHPGASADDLRDLERRFAEVSAAYRKLV